VGVLNIYDIMLAHNVHAYKATKKMSCVYSNSPASNTGAESAVYHCLVLVGFYRASFDQNVADSGCCGLLLSL